MAIPTIPSIPSIPLADFNSALSAAGVDNAIQDIQATMAAKAAEIGDLDIANLDPAALEAKFSEVQEAVSGAMSGMLAKADALKPDLKGLQSMMGDVMAGLSPPGGLDKLISSAGLPDIPSVGDLAGSIGASLQAPSLSGLDAAIDTASKGLSAAGGAIGGIAGSIDSALGDLAASAGSSISDALGAVPKLEVGGGFQVPGIGEIGLGVPSGFNPAKAIPNFQFKTKPLFDSLGKQIGEKVEAIKLGAPSVEPVADDTDDVAGEEINLPKPAATAGSPYLKNNGLLAGIGRSPINKVEAPVSTAVRKDESTGENIVWEWRGSEWVPSGFPDMATFEAQYKMGRQAAEGKVREVVGGLSTVVSQSTTLFQKAAGALNKIEIKIPEAPTEKGSVAAKVTVDSILGVKINAEQVAVLETKAAAVGDLAQDLFDRLGQPLPPGQSPPSPDVGEDDTFIADTDPTQVRQKLAKLVGGAFAQFK